MESESSPQGGTDFGAMHERVGTRAQFVLNNHMDTPGVGRWGGPPCPPGSSRLSSWWGGPPCPPSSGGRAGTLAPLDNEMCNPKLAAVCPTRQMIHTLRSAAVGGAGLRARPVRTAVQARLRYQATKCATQN